MTPNKYAPRNVPTPIVNLYPSIFRLLPDHQSSHSSFFFLAAAAGAVGAVLLLPIPIALVPMALLACCCCCCFCSARLEKSSQKVRRLSSIGAPSARRVPPVSSLPSTKRLKPSEAFLPACWACLASCAAVTWACFAKSDSPNCGG